MSITSRRPAAIAAIFACFALLAGIAGARAQPPAATPPAAPLTVVSYNIRYGTGADGDNHWALRREPLFELLRELDADLLGLQEALDFQIAEILEALPRYAVVGVGRDDGRAAGEYSAILFDRERLRVADSGTFWFSDTPTVPASRSWGNTIPRIATWARFVDRDGRAFWHWNVHLDHRSQASRERSTELLAARIAEQPLPSEPVVVTGDFNAGEDNPAMATLLAQPQGGDSQPPGGDSRPPILLDTFRVLFPNEPAAGTFSGFDPTSTSGPKIDYVLVQPGTEVLEAAIVRWSRAGRCPSDHFPVQARVRLPHPSDPR